jgi:diadenosine tetraphosphate (Ap4A) HIT family hydrolase
VPDLNALAPEHRAQFMLDMSRLGDALTRTMAPVRINYAIFGNLEPALHAHIVPRYRNEPEEFRTQHPWTYDWSVAPAFDPVAHGPLMRALRTELAHLGTLRSP